MSAGHHLTLEQVILRLQQEHNLKLLCDGGQTLGTLWGVLDYVLRIPQGVSDPPCSKAGIGSVSLQGQPCIPTSHQGVVSASLPYRGGDLGSSMRLVSPAHMASLSMGPHCTGLSSLKLLFIPIICKKTEMSGAIAGILYKPVTGAEKKQGPWSNKEPRDILLPH